jgi:hypothetical protein
MAFADGLGGKDKVFAHVIKRIDVSGFDDIKISERVKCFS